MCNFSVLLNFAYLLALPYIRIRRDAKKIRTFIYCPRRIDGAQAELQALEKESLHVYQDTVSSEVSNSMPGLLYKGQKSECCVNSRP